MLHPITPDGLRARSVLLRALRRWFDDHGYVEVPTPVRVPSPAMEAQLVGIPSGDAWLRTSPEFALKRVLAAGLPRIYEIGPCMRAEEAGPWHASEFLMLEWYRAGASLHDLMAEVRALVDACADALGVARPSGWRTATVRDLMAQATGLDIATADAATLSPRDADDWDAAFFRRWIEDVEPALTEPTFVIDWHARHAALARTVQHRSMPTARRFEVFLGGIELANAFDELTDAAVLSARWDANQHAQRAEGRPPHPVDPGLLHAVARMPRTCGIALGVERLLASLLGWSSIHPGRVDVSSALEER